MRLKKLSALMLVAMSSPVMAEDILEAISVTATKIETPASEVPQSVVVMDREAIEETGVRNINDVVKNIPGVTAISRNNGYDSRMIIRGAGVKWIYGVREIMVIRDGVPMTDPGSFTRLDYIDMDDMDSVEVFKGPGSIEAANATGGVIYIRSQSVFDNRQDRVKVGAGSFGSYRANVRKTFDAGEDDSFALNLSHRASDNDWREWNKFDTTQFSLKHGHFFEDDSTLETEFSYTHTNLQFPGSLNDDGFAYYMENGETRSTPEDTGSAFVKSGRYSNIYFLNSRYEGRLGGYQFTPRVYGNWWDHFFYSATIAMKVKDAHMLGIDLPLSRQNSLFGKSGQLVFGLTARQDVKITEMLSGSKGAVIERSDSTGTLYGGYVQQHIAFTPKWSVDVGVRYDRLDFSTSGYQWKRYNYGTGNYIAGIGAYYYGASYDQLSPKVGTLYKLAPGINVYANISQGQQAPTGNEISANYAVGRIGGLNSSTSTQYEVGTRLHRGKVSAEVAAYFIALQDEIVKRTDANDQTYYVNAGRTDKKGVELSLKYAVLPTVDVGGSWEGLDYRYVDFVVDGTDYSGNIVRFTPEQRWTLFASYHKGAWKVRLSGRAMDSYYMDDENTEKYPGYNMVSDLMAAWQRKAHRVQLNITNLFDLRYAEEARKTWYSATYSKNTYVPGAPRAFQLTYTYKF